MLRLAIAVLATIGLLLPSTTGRILADEPTALCGRATTQIVQQQQLLQRQVSNMQARLQGLRAKGAGLTADDTFQIQTLSSQLAELRQMQSSTLQASNQALCQQTGSSGVGATPSQGQANLQGPPQGQVDWGPNKDGWQLTIDNATGDDFLLVSPVFTDNVASAPDRIDARTSGGIKGKPSVFGGPANMNVTYTGYDRQLGSSTNQVSVRIYSLLGDPPGTFRVDCVAQGGFVYSCSTAQKAANLPVIVRFVSKSSS